jgi:hypothetical protein
MEFDLKVMMFLGCLISLNEKKHREQDVIATQVTPKKYFPVSQIVSKTQKISELKMIFEQELADMDGIHFVITNVGYTVGIFWGRLYGCVLEELRTEFINMAPSVMSLQVWTLMVLSGEKWDPDLWSFELCCFYEAIVMEFYEILKNVKEKAERIFTDEEIEENENFVERSIDSDLKMLMFLRCLMILNEMIKEKQGTDMELITSKRYFPINQVFSDGQEMTKVLMKFDQKVADLEGMNALGTDVGYIVGIFGGRLYGNVLDWVKFKILKGKSIFDSQVWYLMVLSGEEWDPGFWTKEFGCKYESIVTEFYDIVERVKVIIISRLYDKKLLGWTERDKESFRSMKNSLM